MGLISSLVGPMDLLTKVELITLTIMILIIALWSYIKWNNRRFEIFAAKIKGPSSYPIIGGLSHFNHTLEEWWDILIKISSDYGPEPFKFWIGPIFSVILMKPEDIRIILNNSMSLEKGWIYGIFKKILGEGLLIAPVDKWHVNRRIITPAFNSNILRKFFPIFNEKIQVLIKSLNKELGNTQQFDLWDYIITTNNYIICQTAMGCNLDTKSNKNFEFINAFKTSSELNSKRFIQPLILPEIIFSIYLRLTGQHKSFQNIKALPDQIIQEKKKAFEEKKRANKDSNVCVTDENNKDFKIFLDILLDLKDAGANFSDDELRDEVLSMIIGGSETTAVTGCLCLLLLAINQDIQDKVYDELYDVFGDGDKLVTFEDTERLMYLEQVLKETLRLYPIAPIIFRRLQDDIKIVSRNIILPKGSTCGISIVGTHHMPELYPNPWTFNPENFSPENIAKRHKYSFLGFSGGPRGCIGSKYAVLSLKVMLSTFLRNYSIHTDQKLSDIKFTIDLIIRSVNGYPVTIRRRERTRTSK